MTNVTLCKVQRPSPSAPGRCMWVLRWRDSHGRRPAETIGRVGVMSKREAERIRSDRQARMNLGLVRRDRPERITLEAFIVRDRESIQADVKPTTLLEYGHAAKHAKAALGGEILLKDIGRPEVGKLKRHLQDLGRKPATIRKTVKALCAMMSRAQAEGLIDVNPFSGAAKGKTQSKNKRIFRSDEIGAMLAVCPSQWWRVFLQLAVTSGLRRDEILHLQWRDIDFEARTVTVSRKDAGRFTVGEGDEAEEFPILPFETKAHSERTVPLSDQTIESLHRFWQEWGVSQYVFLNLDRLRAIDERLRCGRWKAKSELVNNLGRQFTRIQERARSQIAKDRGVPLSKVEWSIGSPHDLRRTYASLMAPHVDLLTLCRWMGHSDPKTTKQFYHDTHEATEARARCAMAGWTGDQYRFSTDSDAGAGDGAGGVA